MTTLQQVDETALPVEAAEERPNFMKRLASLEITPQRIKRRELMHFSRQMAVFIRAGIPVLEALTAITEEMGNKHFKEVLLKMSADLQSGDTFASAADKHTKVFPDYYRGILKSAELTGSLDTALDRLSEYIERDIEARRKVTSALIYPAVIVSLAVVVVVVLSVYVLPRFEKFFKSLDAKLPLATRMLINTTHFIRVWWWVIFLGMAVVAVGLALAARTDKGLAARDRFLLRIPAVGDVIRTALLERFCRIFSGMVTAGVPIPEALSVTTSSMSNWVFRHGLTEAREGMLRGEGLAHPLARTGLFPASAKQMFIVGEATGSLDDQLETAATYFDRELDYKIKRLTTLFEPAVLLVVGAIVGFVAIALVSAMYGIFRQVKP
jgi:type IV pilus assembly protein PilC